MQFLPFRLGSSDARARGVRLFAVQLVLTGLFLPSMALAQQKPSLVPRLNQAPPPAPKTPRPPAQTAAPRSAVPRPAASKAPAARPSPSPPVTQPRAVAASPGASTDLTAQVPVNFTLKNGLRVVLLPDPRQPLVAVRVTYLSGAATDPNRRPGLAHLTEHMAFTPTRHIDQDLLHATLELGASDLNGQTSSDRIVYYATVPSNRLEQLLWLESERMGFSLENFNEKMLLKEQRIVRREIALKGGKGLHFARHRWRFLFPEGHPLHRADAQQPERASLADVQAFFQGTHRPDNAVLAIVGDIQLNQARQFVEKYFGPIVNPGTPRIRVEIPDVVPPGDDRQLVLHGWMRPEVALDFVLPRVRDLKRLACYQLILQHWDDELERGLIETNYLASHLYTGMSWGFRPTRLHSTIFSPPGVRGDRIANQAIEITQQAFSEVEKILSHRREIKLHLISGYQDLQNKAVDFTEQLVIHGHAFSLRQQLEILDSVNEEELRRVLEQDFRGALRTTLFAPGGKTPEGVVVR